MLDILDILDKDVEMDDRNKQSFVQSFTVHVWNSQSNVLFMSNSQSIDHCPCSLNSQWTGTVHSSNSETIVHCPNQYKQRMAKLRVFPLLTSSWWMIPPICFSIKLIDWRHNEWESGRIRSGRLGLVDEQARAYQAFSRFVRFFPSTHNHIS